MGNETKLLACSLVPRPSPSLLQATGSWARACTASDRKLGEGLYCKRREAGRGPVLQATGSWARACTANDGKLGEGLYCKRRKAGRGPGNEAN